MIKLKNLTEKNLRKEYINGKEQVVLELLPYEIKRFENQYAIYFLKSFPNEIENRTEIENDPDYIEREHKTKGIYALNAENIEMKEKLQIILEKVEFLEENLIKNKKSWWKRIFKRI